MNIDKYISEILLEVVGNLYGEVTPQQIQIQKTRKEFEGDYTLVCFPLLKLSRKSPEATATEIGEYVVVARRKGKVWYVAGMSGCDGKKISLNLAKFLPKGSYKAEIFTDGVNANEIPTIAKREVKSVNSCDVLDIEMKSGGGFAIKFLPR